MRAFLCPRFGSQRFHLEYPPEISVIAAMKFLIAATLPLVLISSIHAEKLAAVRDGKQVVIRAGKKEILRYQAEPGEFPRPGIPEQFRRGGYISHIFTPSGRLITDDYPADHFHHHGVWSPWTKTEFEGRHPDFWNMGTKTGTVEFVSLPKIQEQNDGKVGFRAEHRFVDLTAKPSKPVLNETWEISVSVSEGAYIIDFRSEQKCASESPLTLPEYHYGGFGFRGSASWNGKANCRFLSASGKTDRLKLNTSREKWCWIGGKVDGETCGITILSHPSNYRFPQPVRANPNEPFFCFAPQQLGEMKIVPGKSYISRYRMIVTDGELDGAVAEKWFKEYSKIR